MNPQQLALVVVGATLGVLLVLLLLYGRPRRRAQEPLPATFSRGDPDSILEGPRLNKILVWGFASAVLITGILVLYFVLEPFRQVRYEESFFQISIDRGEAVWIEEAACAACHGPGGEGGFAATDPSWPAPPLNNVFFRMTRIEVQRIIEAGRPGTPMPAWAVDFGGPLHPAKVEDVLNFLETIQVPDDEHWELPADLTDGAQVFARKCAVCHGPEGRGQAMGAPLPTFYAPDLTTSFHRLGVPVMRAEVRRLLEIDLEEAPTDEEVDEAFAQVPVEDILEAGERAARNTIERGRSGTPMPAWTNRLTPEHIDAVIEWLRGVQQVP